MWHVLMIGVGGGHQTKGSGTMADFKHWCGNCQIRVYVQRHYGKTLTWADCPYTCEYATAMRCSTECGNEADDFATMEYEKDV